MSLGTCASCAKYSLFFFNIIFFLGGGVVLGVGIWLAVDTEAVHTLLRVVDAVQIEDNHEWHQELTPNVLGQAAYILIAAGAAVFLIGFLGCCGAIRESACCLALYAIALIVILGLEVAAGIYAGVERHKFEENTQKAMQHTLSEYYTGGQNQDGVTWGWNKLMTDLECCGVINYDDFRIAHKWQSSKSPDYKVPPQCCKMRDKTSLVPLEILCAKYPNQLNSNMYKGCYNALKEALKTHFTIVMAVGLGIGLSQILGIFLSFVLCCALDREK